MSHTFMVLIKFYLNHIYDVGMHDLKIILYREIILEIYYFLLLHLSDLYLHPYLSQML